jgi:choline dehydrogenase
VLFQSQKPEKEAIMSQSFDFIVVGSGAGGGVLASRLARNNKNLKVLLIEAGRDPSTNTHYQVPGFHALASEDPKLRWDYFVEHFTNSDIASRDPKRSDMAYFIRARARLAAVLRTMQ